MYILQQILKYTLGKFAQYICGVFRFIIWEIKISAFEVDERLSRTDGKIESKNYFHLEIAGIYTRNYSGSNRERTSKGSEAESFGLCVFSLLKQPRCRPNSKFPAHYDSKRNLFPFFSYDFHLLQRTSIKEG